MRVLKLLGALPKTSMHTLSSAVSKWKGRAAITIQRSRGQAKRKLRSGKAQWCFIPALRSGIGPTHASATTKTQGCEDTHAAKAVESTCA